MSLGFLGRRRSAARYTPMPAVLSRFSTSSSWFGCLSQQRACQSTLWNAKLYKSVPNTSRHSERTASITCRFSRHGVPGRLQQARFVQTHRRRTSRPASIAGSRFAMWQLYRPVNKRLPRTFRSVILAHDSVRPLPTQNARRNVSGSRLLQNFG